MSTPQLRTQSSPSGSDRYRARAEPIPSRPKASTSTGVVTAVRINVLCQGSEKR